MFGPLNPWVGIALVICAFALYKYVRIRVEREGAGRGQVESLERRLGEVERRLTDIQDIVLAIDEKLERQERQISPDK